MTFPLLPCCCTCPCCPATSAIQRTNDDSLLQADGADSSSTRMPVLVKQELRSLAQRHAASRPSPRGTLLVARPSMSSRMSAWSSPFVTWMFLFPMFVRVPFLCASASTFWLPLAWCCVSVLQHLRCWRASVWFMMRTRSTSSP